MQHKRPRFGSIPPPASEASVRESGTVTRKTPTPPARPSGFLRSVLATPTRYAPGYSPFHVKGHVYRSSIGFYASAVPEGIAALETHLDAAHATFFRQHFLTASWYDALPLLQLSTAVAHARGLSHHDAVVERAAAQAEADIHGLYKVILNITSPETVASRVSRAAMQYFDFGESTSRAIDAHTHEISHSGVPMPLVPLSAPLAEGFLLTALRISGAADPSFSAEPPVRTGDVDGTPTYTLRFRISWG